MIKEWNDKGPVIKLIDFGESEQMFESEPFNENFMVDINYCPPEWVDEEPYGFKVDVWGACIVIYMLLTHELPFCGGTDEEVKINI